MSSREETRTVSMSKFPLLLLLFAVHSSKCSLHNAFDEQAWRESATYLSGYIDPASKPCDDFFEHVCGKYGDPSESGFRSARDDDYKAVKEKVKQLLLAINVTDSKVSPMEQGVREFYDHCLNSNDDNVDYYGQLKNASEAILSEILFRSFPSSRDFANDPAKPYSSAIQGILNRVASLSNDRDAIDGFLADFNVWRFAGALERETSRSSYATNSKKIIHLATGPANNRRDADITLIPLFAKTRLVGANQFQRTNLSEIPSVIQTIDWEAYFDEVAQGDDWDSYLKYRNWTVADVFQPERFIKMGSALTSGKGKVDHILPILAGYMTLFANNTTNYTTAESACTETVIRALPSAVARLYFRSLGRDLRDLHRDVHILFRNIRSAFQFLVNNVDWLDADEKDKIQRKIEDIRIFSGIPDWIYDDAAIDDEIFLYKYLPEMTVFENEFRWSRLKFQQEISDAFRGSKVDERPNFTINGGYRSVSNTIKIFLGMTLSLRYQAKFPLALKYGGLGFVMAHELMHALDPVALGSPGPHMDEEWLPNAALREYETRNECLIRQYSKYCYTDQQACVNGTKNAAENIGDIDGLKIAFTAFKVARQVFGDDPPIPGLLNYTQDQVFFLVPARWACAKGLHKTWIRDPHTPNKPRIDAMLRNVPLFARAFECRTGSAYAPLKICSMWGNLDNPSRI